ncbi:MAG: type II secretion system protein GspG [Planctomycetia bacterium]|nr:type II secretion system protein GspG [Planctomycetia bacterium]
MKRPAFTLLELLIVLAILIVIIGIVGTTVWSSYEKALVRSATVQVKTFSDVLETFRMDHNRYPTTQEGLELLVGQVNPAAAGGATTVDPMTGLPVADPNAAAGAIDPMTGLPAATDPTAPVGMDPNATAGAIDPMTGLPADPNATGGTIDPATGLPVANQQTTAPAKSYGKYLDTKDVPKDPWGNKYFYEWPTIKGDGKRPCVWSAGPDRNNDQGAGDDIISWDPTAVNPRAASMNGGMPGAAAIDPLTGEPITTDGFLAPGDMNASGMQGGLVDPNAMQPGMAQPGMMQPGMAQPGMAQPGVMGDMTNPMVQPGVDPGMGAPAQPVMPNP